MVPTFSDISDVVGSAFNLLRSTAYSGADHGRTLYTGDFSLLNRAPMNYGIISDSESERPVMITWGMSTCLALCGYDPKSKVGFLSHNLSGVDFEETHGPIIHELQATYGVSEDDLVFYLTGAIVSNPKHVDKFTSDWVESSIKYISDNFPNSTLETDVLDWDFKSFF